MVLTFHLMKPEPIVISEVTGATNLMHSKNLEHSYIKLACECLMVLMLVLLMTLLMMIIWPWR